VQLRSQNLQQFFRDMDRSIIEANPGSPCAAYDPATQEYHLALPYGGTENNRTVVLNLLTGALTVDDTDTPASGASVRFMVGTDGTLLATDDQADFLMSVDPDDGDFGLATDPSDIGLLIEVNADGDLELLVIGSLPATLFTADDKRGRRVVHSVGYDGFVRIHGTGALDDQFEDGTGGTPITFTVRSRPFFFRSLRNRKRVRSAHITTSSSSAATLRIGVRGDAPYREQTITVPAGSLLQPVRRKILVSSRSDTPQVEVTTTDPVRIAILGMTATVLAEVP
jgi:hypothetical protein